jgi:hypothetical protein
MRRRTRTDWPRLQRCHVELGPQQALTVEGAITVAPKPIAHGSWEYLG